MKKTYSLLLLLIISFVANAQTQTETTQADSKWSASVDVITKYLWRGQAWGGDHFALQPAVSYQATDKLSFGLWATTNFQNEDANRDGTPKGYQELDLGVSYAINDMFTVELWDYYWPTLEQYEGVDNSFFNYGKDASKSLDLKVIADFSEMWLPLTASVNTFIAGNDFRYNSEGDATRNYTTYVELGYSFEEVYQGISLYPVAGAILNNDARYYPYASYDQPSIVNLGLTASKDFELKGDFSLPVFVTYTHNAAGENLEPFGANFVVAGVRLQYN